MNSTSLKAPYRTLRRWLQHPSCTDGLAVAREWRSLEFELAAGERGLA